MKLCAALLLVILPLSLSSCGRIVHEFSSESKTPPPRTAAPVKKPQLSTHKTESSLQRFRQQFNQHIGRENYPAALALIQTRIKKGAVEETLAAEYKQALDGLIRQAQAYQKKGQAGDAGVLFHTAYKGYPTSKIVTELLAMSPQNVQKNIDECAAELMQRGLVAYRAGDLDAAIKTWETIQFFSPGHLASRRALKTAETQRANLQKVPTLE